MHVAHGITARANERGQAHRLLWLLALAGCGDCNDSTPQPDLATATATVQAAPTAAPQASARVAYSAVPSAQEPEIMPEPRCRPDMVRVKPMEPPGDGDPVRAYCVDRYESMLVDSETATRISPYYAPNRRQAQTAARMWESQRFEMGGPDAQAVPLPSLPAWELARDFEPRAVVKKGVTPNGHVSGVLAQLACKNASKRLCTPGEWRTACRGARGRAFPYGERFEHGRCNVFREAHPAMELHDNPSIGHSDPRLNLVTKKGRPLLRKTGATPDCISRWDEDGIHDMVGNLDEWVLDPKGTFAGGFYARASKEGCEWKATGHPFHYADYSTGVRCCADLPSPTPIR
jgi:Sulfatase-modifying factor enzyme 1